MNEQSGGSPFEVESLTPEDARLVELYRQVGRAADDLAYTEDFETFYEQLQQSGDTRSKAEVFRRLLNLRKAGRLPRFS